MQAVKTVLAKGFRLEKLGQEHLDMSLVPHLFSALVHWSRFKKTGMKNIAE